MQTAYNLVPAVGPEGGVADTRESIVILPFLAQGLVPVGKLCTYGTDGLTGPPLTSVSVNSANPGQCRALPNGLVTDPMASSVSLGVPIYDATRAPYDATLGYACYSDKDPVPVIRRGPVYVIPEAGAITQGGDVYVRVAASGLNTVLGAFAPAAGTGLVLFTLGRWGSGLIQGSLAILNLGF